MKYLMFSNRGELDVNGLRLMGASTKRTGSAGTIGFFGSGWKYALATLLRNGAEVVIYSGTRRVAISTQKTQLRDLSFDEIVIDGNPTGLTTSIGPKWVTWMAVRELYSNALDEGDAVVDVCDSVADGVPGFTHVYVSYPTVQDVRENWACYFRRGEHVYKPQLLSKIDEVTRVYRRGMLIHEDPKLSLWDYEVPDCPISEERAAKGPDILEHCWRALDGAGIEAKRLTLEAMKEFEQHLPPWHLTPNKDWAELLDEDVIATKEQKSFWRDEPSLAKARVLPDAWVAALRKLPDIATVENTVKRRSKVVGAQTAANPIRANSMDGSNLRGALKLLARVDIDIQDHEVVLVEGFKEEWIDGLWDPGEQLIYVKRGLTFARLVHVLVHEYLHKTSGADDHERAFESAQGELITRLILKIGGHRR